MKRLIVCPECRKILRALFTTDNPHPGEHVKFVDGSAKNGFKCDNSGEDIAKGESCTAISMWADYGGIPYFEWEKDYLTE